MSKSSGRLILNVSCLSSSHGMWPHSTSTSGKISDISIVLINTSCQGKRPIASTRLAGHSEVPVPAAVRLQASRPLLLSATAADIPRCRDNGGLLHCRPGAPNSDLAQGCGVPARWPAAARPPPALAHAEPILGLLRPHFQQPRLEGAARAAAMPLPAMTCTSKANKQ